MPILLNVLSMRCLHAILLSAVLTATAFAQSESPVALYERGMNAVTGMGPLHNEEQGLEFFRRSAQLNYPPAQLALAYYYETGTLVARDPNQARELYRKAAVQGDPLAAWLAGRHYYVGNGVSHDAETAIKLLKVGASQNNPFAAYFLGRILAERDQAKATALYKIAADQGLPQAQYYYARSLKEGSGVPQDPYNAYVWFMVALDANYTVAGTGLSQIRSSGHLTLAQLNSAEDEAHQLEQVVVRAVNSRGCAGWDGEFDDMPSPPPPTLHPYCH